MFFIVELSISVNLAFSKISKIYPTFTYVYSIDIYSEYTSKQDNNIQSLGNVEVQLVESNLKVINKINKSTLWEKNLPTIKASYCYKHNKSYKTIIAKFSNGSNYTSGPQSTTIPIKIASTNEYIPNLYILCMDTPEYIDIIILSTNK